MKFQHMIAFAIRGASLPPTQDERTIISDDRLRLRVFMTARDDALFEADRRIAIANMLLTGALGSTTDDAPPRESSFEQRLETAISAARDRRHQTHGKGPYLVIVKDGEVDGFAPTNERVFEQLVVCLDAIAPGALPGITRDEAAHAIAALALAGDGVHAVRKAAEVVAFQREDGKTAYSFTFQMSGRAHVSVTMPEDALTEIDAWYSTLRRAEHLHRVERLLVSALEVDEDPLRSFLASWSALEILTAKIFGVYEQELFELIANVNKTRAHGSYLKYVREVMRDKYRLTHKFALVAAFLAPEDADEDLALFEGAKENRDVLLHGQDVDEARLPTTQVLSLARKYLRLHLTRAKKHSKETR